MVQQYDKGASEWNPERINQAKNFNWYLNGTEYGNLIDVKG
jgi:hypothetical protein